MYKKIRPIAIITLLSIILISILYLWSNKGLYKNNNFERNFLKNEPILTYKTILGESDFSIADITSSNIILYEYRQPYNLLYLNNSLDNIDRVTLPIPHASKKIEGYNTIALTDSSFYLLNGKSFNAFKISKDFKTVISSRVNSQYFYQSLVLKTNTFVFVTTIAENNKYRRILRKVNWRGNELNKYLPIKEKEGIYSTDGLLAYNKKSNRIAYMYYYKGIFTCLDTNLRILYNAKTIDTIAHSNLSIINKTTLVNDKKHNVGAASTPPKIVNRSIAISDNYIFINSFIKSNSEDLFRFTNNSVIDIYTIETGKYVASFYIPKDEKNKLTEFRVYNDALYAIYKNKIVMYKLNLPRVI